MKRILPIMLAALLFIPTGASAASTYQVQSGDTLWKVAAKFNTTIAAIKKVSNKKSDGLLVGEKLTIPTAVSATDKQLMAKLVRAEAESEPYAGKVAVATVVLNRVDSAGFPNNVHDVIYETYESGKYYAFSPVQNGQINKAYDTSSMTAVSEALKYRGSGSGSLFFYNPKTSTSSWITERPVTVVIGNHTFAK